jgi:quercetin dioxygenase-like cupin family protein
MTATTTETTKPETPTRGEIEDPIHRVSYSFGREGDDLWVYSWMDDGGHLPEHFHPLQSEFWETLEGSVRVKLDGRWRDLVPADGPVEVAPNIRHELENTSGKPARLRTRVVPAGRLEEFLTESARAARDGLYNARNLPTSLRGAGWLARFALSHRDETVMCSPPPALQRVLLPLAARLGR